MSRIGKKPVFLPSGVEVNIEEKKVVVKGPKGMMTVPIPPHATVELAQEPRSLCVRVEHEEQMDERAIWGLARQLLQNAVTGVQTPFVKSLEFVGTGFKVALEGRTVMMDLGFSHRVPFPLPDGIEAKVEKQVLVISSVDAYEVGETAARIRRLRPPEPYKGKGIKFVDEVIRRKAGKTAKSGG